MAITCSEKSSLSKTQKVLFLHIPKSGGTTVHDALVAQVGKDLTFPSVGHPVIAAAPDSELSNYQLFSGHYNRISIDKPFFDNATKISVLRDPTERILSLYNFWRSIKDEYVEEQNLWHVRLSKKMTLAEFAAPDSEVAFFTHNGLSRNLLAQSDEDRYSLMSPEELAQVSIKYLSTFDSVMLTPFLSLQIPEMMKSLGFEPPMKIGFRREINTHHAEESYLQQIELATYDDKTLQRVAADNEADLLLYDHFLKIYVDNARQQIAKHSMDIQREIVRLRAQPKKS